MDARSSPASLGRVAAPLAAAFGDRLTWSRTHDCVHWCCDGSSAIVAVAPDGRIDATFVAASGVDRVSGRPVGLVYRSTVNAYELDRAGAARMVDDLIAFFSGAREPRFTFVDAVVDRNASDVP